MLIVGLRGLGRTEFQNPPRRSSYTQTNSDFKEIIQRTEESSLKCIVFEHKQILTEDLKVGYKLEEHKEMLTLLGVVGI